MLPFQMIYIGKTSCSLPAAKFPESFLLGFKKLHWSNEEETLPLLKEVISPYITNVKKKWKLPENQVACLIWDGFKAQSTEKVKLELEHLNIKDVEAPKNMTHLSQPFDLATNRVVKKMEQCEFSDYFADCITEALMSDPKRDVTTIKVDLKFLTLKPIHAKTVSKVYKHLKSDKDKQVILNGFWAAGITEGVKKIRENPKSGLNPYWIDYLVDIIVLKKILLCQKQNYFCLRN